MALSTYAELQSSIAAWLHRSDLTAIIPDFVRLAEDRLNNDLNLRAMTDVGTVTTVAGTRYAALPLKLLEVYSVTLETSPRRTLTPQSIDELNVSYANATSGVPANYAIVGENIYFGPIPDSAYTVTIVYHEKLPSLLENSTNWLLTNNPSCYLYACLLSAAPYIVDDALLNRFKALYIESVNQVNATDWCSMATPRVRAR
jgi:hypothetical protein